MAYRARDSYVTIAPTHPTGYGSEIDVYIFTVIHVVICSYQAGKHGKILSY